MRRLRHPADAGAADASGGDGRHVFFGGLPRFLDRTSFPAGGCALGETSCNDGIDDDRDSLVD